jgi:ABC-type transport system substrate-binding protein
MALAFTPTKIQAFDPYSELHSDGYSNLASYSDARVDSMVEALHVSRDAEERRALYRGLQRRVAEDVPSIYTIYIPRVLAVGARLANVNLDPSGPFAHAAAWRVR